MASTIRESVEAHGVLLKLIGQMGGGGAMAAILLNMVDEGSQRLMEIAIEDCFDRGNKVRCAYRLGEMRGIALCLSKAGSMSVEEIVYAAKEAAKKYAQEHSTAEEALEAYRKRVG